LNRCTVLAVSFDINPPKEKTSGAKAKFVHGWWLVAVFATPSRNFVDCSLEWSKVVDPGGGLIDR